MALGPTFLISWWYTPDTKLGIYFNEFSTGSSRETLSLNTNGGLNFQNGMAVSIEENYHTENLITNHPVENTPAITDHIIRQPRIVTISGLITSIRAFPIIGTLDFSQLGRATQLLVELAESNTGITLTTGLLYGSNYLQMNNLVVQSLDIPRNNLYGRSSIKFTMVLKQIIVTSKNGTLTSSSFSQGIPVAGVDIA